MSPIADMVRKLFEKGVDQEAILIAIEAAEQAMYERDSRDVSRDDALERRREADRIRQQRSRDNRQMSRESRDSHVMSQNASLYKESKKEEEGKKERETPTRPSRDRGHRLPDDWQPSSQDQVTAEALVGSLRAAGELAKFRDHWKQQPGSRGVKLDWNAAWRNWIRRAAEFRPAGAANERRKTVHDAARELHENFLNEYVNPFDKPAPSGLCDGESADVVRLLPARGRE